MDPIQTLLDVTCTVFQRMNDQGDMLRVSTNVIKNNGDRAIGTYIPAKNPDGKANPVVSEVLNGVTFKGRAFVVNAWYITAYEPIFDQAKNVVGVLYVGIPQENVKSLRKAIMEMKIGTSGFVTVVDGSGKTVISPEGKKDGQDVSGLKGAHGKSYMKEILDLAKTLQPRQIGEEHFFLKNGSGVQTSYDARFVYFKPWDWVIIAQADQADFTRVAKLLSEIGKQGNLFIAGVGLVVLVITALVWFVVANTIVRPINSATDGLRDVAEGEGDLTQRLKIVSRDEVGTLAQWFNVFIEKLQGIISVIAGNTEKVSRSSQAFLEISQTMSDGANSLADKSEAVASAAEEMSANLSSVAAAVEQSSTNISMVSAAAEEMTSTIGEIAKSSEKTRVTSSQAVEKSTSASGKVAYLSEAAQEIGNVVETINDISEQTNLLALNATIEAARAGEAGKGFAVVAGEIKSLAQQTAEATFEIKAKIENIQSSTQETVSEIKEISVAITDVNEMIDSVAAAVEEQSVTTREIAENVGQAAAGIQEITENVSQSSGVATQIAQDIADVNQASSEMSESSQKIKIGAEELNELSKTLQSTIGQFKV